MTTAEANAMFSTLKEISKAALKRKEKEAQEQVCLTPVH